MQRTLGNSIFGEWRLNISIGKKIPSPTLLFMNRSSKLIVYV